MKEFLLRNLHGDVEGTCSGRVGFIICVLTVTNISPGKVLPGSGLAEFVVQYQAIVFKPYKGEVVDAIVTSVNQVMTGRRKEGGGEQLSWLPLFSMTATTVELEKRSLTWLMISLECYSKIGFFADVGPLQVFVAQKVGVND